MNRIVVTGAAGRMGSQLVSAVLDARDLKMGGATERKGHPSFGKDIGELIGRGKVGVLLTDRLEAVLPGASAMIDFTTPEGTIEHLGPAAENKVPAVIGTTGFSKGQLEEIRRTSETIPIVLAPNMSVGVNVLLKVLAVAAKALGDNYDVEIVEMHHRLKKDAPSGTAIRLAQVVAEALGRDLDKTARYERHGVMEERAAQEIGIQTLRGGDVVGDHTVIFAGPGERLEFIHRAHSRGNFARGAILAARWLFGRPPGLYDMQDVLGLKQ